MQLFWASRTQRSNTTKKEKKKVHDLLINILSKQLHKEQTQVINKGLNYIPTFEMDRMDFLTDFYTFCCNIRLKMHFYEENKKKKTEVEECIPKKLKRKSKFDPVVESTMLEVFQNVVINEVTEKWTQVNNKCKTMEGIE